MAKRFTDTEIYNKKWFRELTPTEKCFWRYICDACNHAGIWEVDFETAGFFINKKLNELKLKEIFKEKYIEIDNGKRWFIVGFIEFQYGKLSGGHPAHISVIKILNKHGIELEEMDIIRPIDKRMSVWIRDRGICLYCNKEIKKEEDFNVDHIIPKSQQGTDSYRNLASSCFKCNNKKSGKSIKEVGFIELNVKEYHIKKAYFDLENDVDLMIKFKGFFGKTKLPKVEQGCQHVDKIIPKDKDKDIYKDKDKIKDKDKDKYRKIQYLDCVFLTEIEYEKIKEWYGEQVRDKYIEDLNGWIHQIGKKKADAKYKSHYATILNWIRRDGIQKIKKTKQPREPKPLKKRDPRTQKLIDETVKSLKKKKEVI